jgi:hypothetical protein
VGQSSVALQVFVVYDTRDSQFWIIVMLWCNEGLSRFLRRKSKSD